jgi:hypothetical protein
MFFDNKYTKTYYKLIDKYCGIEGEKHHIIPRSLGGTNKKENIVIVPPRIHFILHKLLVKMVIDPSYKTSMYYALFMMMNRNVSKFNSKNYELVRKEISEAMKLNNPMFIPSTSKKFKRKRPEQSVVAIKRNLEYWKDKARPILKIECKICSSPIITRIPTKETCSRQCSTKLQWQKKKRPVWVIRYWPNPKRIRQLVPFPLQRSYRLHL